MSKAAIYKEIAQTTPTGGGNIIRDGSYLFCIRSFGLEHKRSGLMSILELEVLESQPAEAGIEPNPVGSICSWVMNLTGGSPNAASAAKTNLKAFALSLCGLADEDVDEAQVMELLSELDEGKEAVGRHVRDDTYRKIIKGGANQGKPFTCHKWTYVKQTDEEIAAERARMSA